MPWSEKLREWASGPVEGHAGGGAAGRQLVVLAAQLQRQAEQLDSHTELAPNEHAERELRRLAAELRHAVEPLREALARRGIAALDGVPAVADAPAGSHWARLVQDLEALRGMRARLVDVEAVVDEGEPDLAAVTADLLRAVEGQLLGLRGLIARADPQALN